LGLRVEGSGFGDAVNFFLVNLMRSGQLTSQNVKRFRGGLVFKAGRFFYQSTLGLRVIKKKEGQLTSARLTATPHPHHGRQGIPFN